MGGLLMKISVVIPVYNVEKYLRQCIDSVIAQSYPDIEVILINDGSTDNSMEICREYEVKYSSIKLINKKNGGLSDARNVGILNSTGEYILFLDSDDYWCNHNFLFDLVQYIIKHPNLDYVFFKYKYYYQKKDIYIEPTFNLDHKEFVGKSGIQCLDYILSNMKNFQWYAWAGIVRREFIVEKDLFFIKGRKYEDILWTPHIFINGEFIGFYNNTVYAYRLEREGQITGSNSYKSLEDNIFVSTTWYNYLKNYNIHEELKKKLFMNINAQYFNVIKFAGFLNNNEKNQIILLLRKNKYLLEYCMGKNKIIMVLCKVIGFTLTVTLMGNIKRFSKVF